VFSKGCASQECLIEDRFFCLHFLVLAALRVLLNSRTDLLRGIEVKPVQVITEDVGDDLDAFIGGQLGVVVVEELGAESDLLGPLRVLEGLLHRKLVQQVLVFL